MLLSYTVKALSCLFGLLLLVLCFQTARADFKSDTIARYESSIAKIQQNLTDSEAVLRAPADGGWSDLDLEQHLHNALFAVYTGIVYYEYDNRELPTDVASLAGTKYVPNWPANPLNNFEPVQVLGLADEFSPGELVLQICPPEFYSKMNDSRPLSFELAVYGPTVEFAALGTAAPLKINTWAVTPEGALYMAGAHTETAISMREKWETMQQAAAAE